MVKYVLNVPLNKHGKRSQKIDLLPIYLYNIPFILNGKQVRNVGTARYEEPCNDCGKFHKDISFHFFDNSSISVMSLSNECIINPEYEKYYKLFTAFIKSTSSF